MLSVVPRLRYGYVHPSLAPSARTPVGAPFASDTLPVACSISQSGRQYRARTTFPRYADTHICQQNTFICTGRFTSRPEKRARLGTLRRQGLCGCKHVPLARSPFLGTNMSNLSRYLEQAISLSQLAFEKPCHAKLCSAFQYHASLRSSSATTKCTQAQKDYGHESRELEAPGQAIHALHACTCTCTSCTSHTRPRLRAWACRWLGVFLSLVRTIAWTSGASRVAGAGGWTGEDGRGGISHSPWYRVYVRSRWT